MDVLTVCSIAASAFAIGFLAPAYMELNKVRKELKDKVKEFEEITKLASEANQTFASKILQLEDKISTVEFWKASNSNFTGKK